MKYSNILLKRKRKRKKWRKVNATEKLKSHFHCPIDKGGNLLLFFAYLLYLFVGKRGTLFTCHVTCPLPQPH
jgi:hypothetical protein